MTWRSDGNARNSSTVAFEAVLRAEGACEERIRQARRDAAAIMTTARAREEAIKRRADARISRAHVAHLRKIDAEIGRLESALISSPNSESSAEESAALAKAIATLAAELTGQADDRFV